MCHKAQYWFRSSFRTEIIYFQLLQETNFLFSRVYYFLIQNHIAGSGGSRRSWIMMEATRGLNYHEHSTAEPIRAQIAPNGGKWARVEESRGGNDHGDEGVRWGQILKPLLRTLKWVKTTLSGGDVTSSVTSVERSGRRYNFPLIQFIRP